MLTFFSMCQQILPTAISDYAQDLVYLECFSLTPWLKYLYLNTDLTD